MMDAAQRPSLKKSSQHSSIDPAKRQRKWAPKTRTGCVNCRARHVKCDETKPECKRCQLAGKSCTGYLSQPQTRTPESSWIDKTGIVQQHRPVCMPMDLRPETWDFVEGCRFRESFIHPYMLGNLIAPNVLFQSINSKPLQPPTANGIHIDVAHAFAVRLGLLLGTHGTRVVQNPSVSQLWSKYHHHSSKAHQAINEDIAHADTNNTFWTLLSVHRLYFINVVLPSTIWRTHLEGFFALLRVRAGNLPLKDAAGPVKILASIMMSFVIATNTTGPSNDQSRQLANFSTADICNIHGAVVSTGFPCPSHLLLDILRINKLRYQAGISKNIPKRAASAISEHIDAFTVGCWGEQCGMPEEPYRSLIGEIFKSAVALYGILSLWQYVDVEAGFGSLDSMVKKHRRTLLSLIEKAMVLLHSRAPLCWPVAVAGVAAGRGTATDQALVENYLCELGPNFHNSTGPMRAKTKLKAFWASGKKEWDECFDEPCFILANWTL